MSSQKMKKIAWLVAGAMAGGVLTLSMQALADKEASPLPLNELRTFAEVFSLIKQSYVEPVTDKKLIDEAIKAC